MSSELNIVELKKSIDSGNIGNFYIFTGEEYVILEEYIKMVCKKSGLKVVSSSNRYDKNLLPSPTDYSSDIVGSDGQYYFGSVFKNRELSLDVAFDDIDEPTWRKIAQLFSTDKPQDLVFDELPFKTYKAKLKNKPDFKFICFTDKRTGQRVYKGEGKISFICYYPYAFGFDKYLTRAADGYYTPHMEVPKDTNI